MSELREWNRARADEGFAPNLSHVEIRKARLGRLDLRGAELANAARLIDQLSAWTVTSGAVRA